MGSQPQAQIIFGAIIYDKDNLLDSDTLESIENKVSDTDHLKMFLAGDLQNWPEEDLIFVVGLVKSSVSDQFETIKSFNPDNLTDITQKDIESITDFCEANNIKYGKPQWYLTAKFA